MANTYGNLYIHLIFSVYLRQSLLINSNRELLFRFLNTQINSENKKLIAVNGYKDHIHTLVSFHPEESLSSFVQKIKISSSKFLKENTSLRNFNWQNGYGYFSCSQSQVDKVVKYIENQEEHHRVKSFREEYENFLIKYKVPYNPKYVFEYYDNLNID